MKKGKKTRWLYKAAGMAVLLGAAFWCSNSGLLLWKPEVLTVLAESESGGSLSSVTEAAKILPIPNSDGKYMLKSDGFYCLNEDGSGDCTQAIHYFDHFVVDGTVFNGYYYHDETGKFKASEAHLTAISQEALPKAEDGTEEAGWTSGIYVVNNLGRLSGTGRVCILKEEIGQIKLDGGYYVDRNGKVCQEGGIYYIQEMNVGEKRFSGYYYFDESSGVLVEEAGTTPEGLTIQKDGCIKELTDPGIKNLKKAVKEFTEKLEGDWSVYVKDLKNGEKFSINDKAMSSASLIKAFTMAASYENMEKIRMVEGMLLKADPASQTVTDKLFRLMENMVTYSDNESFNEMVRLQTASNQFNAGARVINRYLREQGYKETAVLHTLAPSNTDPEGLGSSNMTSVEDCGTLLEKIYRRECVSPEDSDQMLSLLLNQDTRTKIPGGLKESVQVANKTGENDKSQHDIGIVYGARTDYILCVMSENAGKEADAVSNIQRISAMAYYYLN
ncbi:serine hydrolase [Ruminococcus sp. 1001275B_160808_F8]|uniref:serine hydrolase n=1 Tax=Ruminococcus sp. 1001275B_160808_F8 TaxID=2787131 RepID=UPI0018A9C28F|nr:serine hydrolase [Ruminococcus sp. 1001275B_160808_F8]